MQLDQFFNAVEQHPVLEGLSIEKDGNEGRFAIRHTESRLVTVVPASDVLEVEWPVLEEILTGQREPHVLYHMTRVVGYFSRTENWNKSKLGELADRHAGDYALPATEAS